MLFLLDTRISPEKKSLYLSILVKNLGDEYSVYIFPGLFSGTSGRNAHVGGITLIARKSHLSGWSVSRLQLDPSKCGLYLVASLHHSSGRRVRAIGVYLPTSSSDPSFGSSLGSPPEEASLAPSAFASKIRSHMAGLPLTRQFPTVEAWFWHLIGAIIADADWEAIMVGDFNRSWPVAKNSPFQRACADVGLSNSLADALRSRDLPYQSTCTSDGRMINDLDHVISTLPMERLRGGGTLSGPSWVCAGSDHVPIWAGFSLSPRRRPLKPEWERTERRLKLAIDRRDEDALAELAAKSSSWLADNPPPQGPQSLVSRNLRLEELQSALRETAEEHFSKGPKKRSSPGRYFFGEFPVPLQLLKIHLHTLILLRRLLAKPLSSQSYRDGSICGPRLREYLIIISSWRDHAIPLHRDLSETDRFRNPLDGGTSRDTEWWYRARSPTIIWDALVEDIAALNRRSKVRYRSLRSESIREAVKKREQNIKNNRIRQALASLLGTHKPAFLYDTMACADGSLEADPVEIHRMLQRHYMKYFEADSDSLLQRLNLDMPDLGSSAQWERFLDHPDEMAEAFLHPPEGVRPTAVPAEYVHAICKAFQRSPSAISLEADLTTAMAAPFTFKEFQDTINSGGKSSPGESGTTYRLLQVAPTLILEEIFDILDDFFSSATTPDAWRRVLLILIQKNLDKPAAIGNFRPIGLLEVLRKVWTKMILQRLMPLLDRHSVLQPNQFAFLPGRGTASELVQLVNVLEEVSECGIEIDLTTADVKGAFDSPERMAQWASWRRIGVPAPLATYLTNLAALSSYRLTSPYGMRKNLDPLAEGVDPRTDCPWFPSRGGTQGDPLSTIAWVVFFDILLTALNEVQREFPFYVRHNGSLLLPQLPPCYADDLHSVSPCREATVKANCIISAFAAMFGVVFAPEKLRAVTTAKDPGEVVLYTREWEPIRKPFGDAKAYIKSLGIEYNLVLNRAPLFKAAKQKLTKIARTLGPRQSSIMAKAMAQTVSTPPKLVYPLQYYSFSTQQHLQLSAIMVQPLRSAKMVGTRIHHTVLTNPFLGGFMQDLDTLVQDAKLRLFNMAMDEGGATRRAMECLCLRLCRRDPVDMTLLSDHVCVPVSPPTDSPKEEWWAKSLIRRAAEDRTSMVIQGTAPRHQHVLGILPHLSAQAQTFLDEYDLNSLEELIFSSPDSPPCPISWLNSPDLLPGGEEVASAIASLLTDPAMALLATSPIPISREQMFQLSPESFFRVAGVLPNGDISGRHYSRIPRSPTRLQLDPEYPSFPRGSGFSTHISCESLQAPEVRRIIVANGGSFWEIKHTLPPRTLQLPPLLPVSPPAIPTPPCLLPVLNYLDEQGITPTHMSSDAGFAFAGGEPGIIFTQPKLNAGACNACIMIADDSFQPEVVPPAAAVIIEGMERIPFVKSFLTELIGGIAMVHMRSNFKSIIQADMDCKSVIDLQTRRDISSGSTSDDCQRRPYGLLLRAFRGGMGHQPWVRHGQAHPERARKATATLPGRGPIPIHLWTRRNWLNYLADRNADPDPEATADHPRRRLSPRRTFRIPVETLLTEVMGPDAIYWIRDGYPTPNRVGSLLPPVTRAMEYLSQRDLKALSRPIESRQYPPDYWYHSCIGILKDVLDRLGAPRHSDLRCALLCLIWDLIPTGRRKGLFAGLAAESCPLCGMPDSLEHMVFQCHELRLVRIETIRDAHDKYAHGRFALSDLPSGCSERARAYIREYITYASNVEERPELHLPLSLWLARPQTTSLLHLHLLADSPAFTVKELRYTRKELVSVSAKLVLGVRAIWKLRCTLANESSSGFTSISCSRLSPHETQSSISEYLASTATSSPDLYPSASPPSRDSDFSSPGPPAWASVPSPPASETPPTQIQYRNSPSPAERSIHLNSQTEDIIQEDQLPATGPSASSPARYPETTPPEGLPPIPRYPVRRNRTTPGYAEHLQLHADVSTAGKLPASFIPSPITDPTVYTRGLHDYTHSWVQESYFCPGGGLAYFFRVLKGQTLPPGCFMGEYAGRDNRKLKISYKEGQKSFRHSDYALACPHQRYIVDGQNGSTISGPARANDGFETHNCLFTYNPVKKWMEMILQARLEEGIYEALVNYDTPGAPPSFWRPHRFNLLPLEAQDRCRAYYQHPDPEPCLPP